MLVTGGVLGTSTRFTTRLPANVGPRNCMQGYHSGQLLKIRDAYLVAAWMNLYDHIYEELLECPRPIRELYTLEFYDQQGRFSIACGECCTIYTFLLCVCST